MTRVDLLRGSGSLTVGNKIPFIRTELAWFYAQDRASIGFMHRVTGVAKD